MVLEISQGVQRERKRRKERHADWKGRIKQSQITDDAIVYVEKSKESTEKFLELAREFNNVVGQRSIYESQSYSYISVIIIWDLKFKNHILVITQNININT